MGLSIGGGGQRQTQKTSESVDRESASWLRAIWGAGQTAGQAGPGPLLTSAGTFGTAAQGAGNVGLLALGGDPAAVARLQNPYDQNVIDRNNEYWRQINQQTANQINDQATQARAFGGSRHGVAEGVALAQNNQAQAQQNAGLLQSGYDAATARAAQLAQLGFQGSNLNTQLGLAGVGNPELWRLIMARQGFVGPLGTTSSSKTNNVGGGFSFGFEKK